MKTIKKEFKKLPKSFKTKWITALRSGKFKQTSNHLKSPIAWNDDGSVKMFGYCCLGVACAVVGYNKLHGETAFISGDKKKIPTILHGEKSLTRELACMNDSGVSFKKIAKWIEKHL